MVSEKMALRQSCQARGPENPILQCQQEELSEMARFWVWERQDSLLREMRERVRAQSTLLDINYSYLTIEGVFLRNKSYSKSIVYHVELTFRSNVAIISKRRSSINHFFDQ